MGQTQTRRKGTYNSGLQESEGRLDYAYPYQVT